MASNYKKYGILIDGGMTKVTKIHISFVLTRGYVCYCPIIRCPRHVEDASIAGRQAFQAHDTLRKGREIREHHETHWS